MFLRENRFCLYHLDVKRHHVSSSCYKIAIKISSRA